MDIDCRHGEPGKLRVRGLRRGKDEGEAFASAEPKFERMGKRSGDSKGRGYEYSEAALMVRISDATGEQVRQIADTYFTEPDPFANFDANDAYNSGTYTEPAYQAPLTHSSTGSASMMAWGTTRTMAARRG
jgi:hypothetical protein